jgi:hypothetical protein
MLKHWMNRYALEINCQIEGVGGVRPHSSQSLAGIRSLLLSCWKGDNIPFTRGKADSMIVLAVDALRFDTIESIWSPDVLLPLTSTFPSTSVTAWLTSMTSLSVDEHIVPGVVYFLEEANGLFHAFRGRALTRDNNYLLAPDVRIGPWTTIFDLLSADGAECVANIGDLVSWPGPWSDAVIHGARAVLPVANWDEIRLQPLAIVQAAIEEVNAAIKNRHIRQPLMVWNWLNFDDYVHYNGYNLELLNSLRLLQNAIERWTAEGHMVIAHSDHGMVPSHAPRLLLDGWDTVNQPSLCRLAPGGAGRIRWSYPKAGQEIVVFERLAAALGTNALVVFREDLQNLGLLKMNDIIRRQIGEVVVIATKEDFVVPDPTYTFEHGSFTPGEMIVPFAIWHAC